MMDNKLNHIEFNNIYNNEIKNIQMNTDQYSNKSHSTMGALEINLSAREQEKVLNQIEATWMMENRPAKANNHNGIKNIFDRLQAGLFVPTRQLAGASHD